MNINDMVTNGMEVDERAEWGKLVWAGVVEREPKIKLCGTPTQKMERENEPAKETKREQKGEDNLERMVL